MLPPGLPQYTLGYGVLDWCSEFLSQPNQSVDKVKGDLWEFMDDQALFVLWFYAVDESGSWLFNKAYRERAKGTGKSPMVAAIACAEFLGPVRFSHFDPRVPGGCVGRQNQNARIWFSAISEDGSKHTYNYACAMLEGKAEHIYNLEVGLTRIQVNGSAGKRFMRVVSASAKSREGDFPSFAVKEETQNWLPADHGDNLNEVIDRSLGKTDGRSIEVTNAPAPGMNSIAEGTHKYQAMIQAGTAKNKKLLFDTFAIHVDDIKDPEQAMPALKIMYQDAPWINVDRIMDEIQDPSHREVNSRRFYFNEMVEPRAQWLNDAQWNACGRDIKLKKKDLISLGFRSIKNCCSIVACRLSDQAIFVLDTWEKPHEADRSWEVPYATIDGRMRSIFEKYNVFSLLASPESFQDIVGRWSIDYEGDIEVEELWTTRNKQKKADAIELFETAVLDQRLIHDGDVDLTRHIMNCFTEEVAQGILIRMATPYSSEYIVTAEAAILAVKARNQAIADGALKEGPSRYVYSF